LLGALKAAGACLIDFFYPTACVGCGCGLKAGGEFLCSACRTKIISLGGPECCPRCGMPQDAKSDACTFCPGLDHSIETAFSAAWYIGPVPDMVHLLKYRGMHRLSLTVAGIMANCPEAGSVIAQADILVPVPLYFWRKLRRGYNQSEKIAEALAHICGKQLETGALARIRSTKTQTLLSVEQRKNNVAGAFKVVNPQAISGCKACLIDDVMTTGATMSACATALKEVGASSITAYTFARV
jgi:ComF family protein